MGIEMIIGLATALLAVIAGAFGIGHARGTSKAEAKADKQRTEENAAAAVAAERKAEVTKEASDVQQTVSHMPDDDVDRELREKFTRPGGG
jgi:NAD/NADP transhydrogenase beta subunit